MGESDQRPGEEHVRRTHSYVRILMPALREVARRHGYALALHGSLERDIDVVAVPWAPLAANPAVLVDAMFSACEAILGSVSWPQGWTPKTKRQRAPSGALPNPEQKPHGRLGWVIMLSGGPYIDLSVMPTCLREAK